jgi:hypothetical protein
VIFFKVGNWSSFGLKNKHSSSDIVNAYLALCGGDVMLGGSCTHRHSTTSELKPEEK